MAKIALYQHGAAHTILAIAMAQVKQRALKRKGAVAAAVKQARLLRGVLRAKGTYAYAQATHGLSPAPTLAE